MKPKLPSVSRAISCASICSSEARACCAARLPSHTATLRPLARLCAIARASSLTASGSLPSSATLTSAPFSFASATTTWPRAATIAEGATSARLRTGISHSSALGPMALTCRPFLAAWRTRCASSGASLRRKLPTTSRRVRSLTPAIGIPSHGAPARLPSARKSAWRRRKSMFSLPSPRISFCSRWSSSTVACGEASAPIEAAP